MASSSKAAPAARKRRASEGPNSSGASFPTQTAGIVDAPEEQVLAAASRVDDRVTKEIQTLQQQQRALRDERRRVAAELRNAQKRRQRLKHRSRLLSSADLVAVLALREQEHLAQLTREAQANRAETPSEPVAEGTGARPADDDRQIGE